MKFVVEKLKEGLIAMENIGGDAFAWFRKIFRPETRGDKIHHWLHVNQPYLITAVILSVIVYFCKGGGGGSGSGKMMKAPGRNCKMPRDVFEVNPKEYFRDLRAYP